MVLAYFLSEVDIFGEIAGDNKVEVATVYVRVLESIDADTVAGIFAESGPVHIDVYSGRSIDHTVTVGRIEANQSASSVVCYHVPVVGWDSY